MIIERNINRIMFDIDRLETNIADGKITNE